MKKSVLIMVMVGLAVSSLAEFRTWTDRKGNTVEAELAGTEGKKIILRKQDGKTIALSPLLLSDDDKEYLHGKISADLFDPAVDALDLEKPRLEIQFKKVSDTENEIGVYGFRDVHMVGLVNIIRKSGKPYSGYLKASVYMIGHNKGINGYVLLDTTSHDLDLEKNSEISLCGTKLIIREDKEYYTSNTQYAGYVVVVTDEEGGIIALKSSNPKYEEIYKRFEKCKRGTIFSWDFYKKSGSVPDVRYVE